jgi:hypothetical protein
MSDPRSGSRSRAASALTDEQRHTLFGAADVLIPRSGDIPSASETPGFGEWLDRALAARSEIVPELRAVLDSVGVDAAKVGSVGVDAAEVEIALRTLDSERPDDLRLVTDIVAGAYFMIPEVLARIGYPGQHRAPARLAEAADELETGILDPVINRGWQVRYPPEGP